MRVLLLGATGVVGTRAAGELMRASDVTTLLVAGRCRDEIERRAQLWGGDEGRAQAVVLDASDSTAIADAAAGADVIASCAGPGYLLEAAGVRAAIAAGVDYVSLCDDHDATEEITALGASAIGAGSTIVSGCGLSPGITNLLIALAAARLDEVDEITIAVAAASADPQGVAARLHFLHGLTRAAPVISDHRLTSERSATSPRLVYFPEPVGWVETFLCGHPEVVTLAAKRGRLRSLQFRIGLGEKVVMDTVRASVATRALGVEVARQTWLRAAEPLRPLLERIPPHGPPWTAARVDVRGTSEGRSSAVSYAVVDRLANLASVPIAYAALQLGRKDVTNPGVRAPEEVFSPKPFLRALAERGIRIARLEPAPV